MSGRIFRRRYARFSYTLFQLGFTLKTRTVKSTSAFGRAEEIIPSSRNRNLKTALPIPDTAALCWKGCRLSKVFSLVGLETNTGIRDTGTLLDFLL